MTGRILISTAYLPPVEYFSVISSADEILVEKEENYIKQTYRNRCYILSAHGPLLLTVPVYSGSVHKTAIKDLRIDYSKRWQQVHLRAMTASYNSAPFFEYYFDSLERIISSSHLFLLDLNMELTETINKFLKIEKPLSYSTHFEPAGNDDGDFRYKISPKKVSTFRVKKYTQVFGSGDPIPGSLSIIDLIFNKGPDSAAFLRQD
jgi:hypothetical protein